MPTRSFNEDATQATATEQPVPRGIVFRFDLTGESADPCHEVEQAVSAVLTGWEIREVDGLPGWFEAIAPVATDAGPGRALALGEFWHSLRAVRSMDRVHDVEPLLLISSPQPAAGMAAEAFAAGLPREAFNLWGFPYERKVRDEIERLRKQHDWHLAQMRVREAWALWNERFPNLLPGHDILVGHPDTGYSEHPEVRSVFKLPGRSFLRDARGIEEPSALDDLRVVGGELIEAPGHGTGTACVIASGERDQTESGAPEAFGVAPGSRVLPLRVSRSVIHFDFSNVGRAILYAVDHNADVISMSLGGPCYSGFVRQAIGKALDDGVIVVAAAGNYLPATAFPAAFPEVIGVAATHAAAGPWRFSAIGRLVDIAAPGEDVWHAHAAIAGSAPDYSVTMASGTSYATACVAGVAALWLSYHGGRQAIADHYGGQALVPFAFQYLLTKTAKKDPPFDEEGNHGKGIVDAEALLRAPLPVRAVVTTFKSEIMGQRVNPVTFFAGLLTGGRALTDAGSVAAGGNGPTLEQPAAEAEPGGEGRPSPEYLAQTAQLNAFFHRMDADLLEEAAALIAADRTLLIGLHRWRPGESRLPLLDRLLRSGFPAASGAAAPALAAAPVLSEELRQELERLRKKELDALAKLHKGTLGPGVSPIPPTPAGAGTAATATEPPAPVFRHLRAYSFDPSLGTMLETAPIYQVTIPVRWESALQPGPLGEYLEVVDIDPASGCVYAPIDLNHPHILSQEGLPLSEGSPQFHQQMVYAVAMNTIHRFELALGRPIFWSSLRPWAGRDYPEEKERFTPEALALLESARATNGGQGFYDPLETRYVQRLRVHPHALREANAYYSPTKRALLFGYFPSGDESGRQFPGGTIFTCLSHDIIAHETTHALVDGMHPYFNEASNEDVWAFHEAYADIMALFQHFTYPEVLRHQIANTRGDLETDNLLGQLAQQFGQAIGQRGALRDYLGGPNEEGVWQRTRPNPRVLKEEHEPHARGSVLVAAVFDAFLALYNDRIRDLVRIATGGTGVLPAGQIHPDLTNRLAAEAAQTADDVLQICIRAMDYVPPVDITFGEFLRALITADYDLAPGVRRKNRIAFIEAFRAWGIYPRDVTTLSEDSLRWRPPDPDSELPVKLRKAREDDRGTATRITAALEMWQPGMRRDQVFQAILGVQRELHTVLEELQGGHGRRPNLLPGLDWRRGARFTVHNLRPARRLGPHGEFRTEIVFEVIQTDRSSYETSDGLPLRGGATLVLDLSTWEIRYIIYKGLYQTLPEDVDPKKSADQGVLVNRLQRRLVSGEPGVWRGEGTDSPGRQLRATYSSVQRRRNAARTEPFALLHGSV
jgi:hypothetical protein